MTIKLLEIPIWRGFGGKMSIFENGSIHLLRKYLFSIFHERHCEFQKMNLDLQFHFAERSTVGPLRKSSDLCWPDSNFSSMFWMQAWLPCLEELVCVCVVVVRLCDPMDCSPLGSFVRGISQARLLCPLDFPGKNTGVGCLFLLQGIFLTQGLNLGLPHCRRTL